MAYTKCFIIGVVSILAILSTSEAMSVGSHFTVCKTKDKNFQDCFRTSAEKALQGVISDGIPELGLVPLDPLIVPRLLITTGEGAVGLTLKLENGTHAGLRKAKIVSSKADPKNHRFELKLRIPTYSATGPYEASGRILLLPITGKGQSGITYHDFEVNWVIQGKSQTDSRGKTYMDVEKFDVKIHAEKASIMMTNLFNGDKTLGDTMLKFLNEHQKEFIKEIEPSLNEAFSQLYLGMSKQIFKRLPYDEIFPDL